MGGQQPPKKGIRRVGGRTRRVDVVVHHAGVNRPAAEVAYAIDNDADRCRATGRPLAQPLVQSGSRRVPTMSMEIKTPLLTYTQHSYSR